MAKNFIVILVLVTTLMIVIPANGAEYQVGTSFTVEIDVDLDGESGTYIGYDETEYEVRQYEIIGVSDEEVEWRYHRAFKFDSNEGEHFTQDDIFYVTSDINDRSYISNEDDPDAAYYVFDKIWWRIHPGEIEIGDTVRILGADYTYLGIEAISLSATKAIKAMKLQTQDYQYQVFDPEYDPDGYIDLNVDETFYFDINTGYILKSNWKAYVETSVGDFSWDEEIVLTASTFPVENDWSAYLEANNVAITIILVLFITMILGITMVRKSWQEEVQYAIDLMQGKIQLPPATTALVPTTWSPLDLSYKTLEMEKPSSKKMYLANGIFIVTETENRLVIADTNSERYHGNQIINQTPESLRMFYRLALGKVSHGSPEANLIQQTLPEVVEYITTETPETFGFVDQSALQVYQQRDPKSDPEYEEVTVLLARRKVLDYSHGQAPLSPTAHLQKVQIVLDHDPSQVFLVGDDDLISITLARRGVNVTLVEIDPYTLSLIDGIKKQEKLPITISQVDLRDPLPFEYRQRFDLFVADPDFTIQSFALFLSRGLSSVKHGGIGLINFENSFKQRFKAKFLLHELGITVLEEIIEPWKYMVIRNEKIPIRAYRYGKYTIVDYADDLVLDEAGFTSRMFVIRKDRNAEVALPADQTLSGPADSIYDY